MAKKKEEAGPDALAGIREKKQGEMPTRQVRLNEDIADMLDESEAIESYKVFE
jgi:hypothetical protein